MQLDTATTKAVDAKLVFSCYICNSLDHSSLTCPKAGTIFDDRLSGRVSDQLSKGDAKAPQVTYIEWTKAEEDNDYDARKETQEQYYLRCIPKAKGGHVLDAKFMGQIARLSHRLGLIDTDGWGNSILSIMETESTLKVV